MSARKQSVAEMLFIKYEHLAKKYALKVFNLDRISFDKEDVQQEFRLKLFQVIIAYGKALSEKKNPIPLNIYIRSSLGNFVQDFIEKIEHDKNRMVILHGDHTFDYAVFKDSYCEIDLKKCQIIINGFDLLDGLSQRQKLIFCMYCEGHDLKKLNRLFKMDCEVVIKRRRAFIAKNKQKFISNNAKEFLVNINNDED